MHFNQVPPTDEVDPQSHQRQSYYEEDTDSQDEEKKREELKSIFTSEHIKQSQGQGSLKDDAVEYIPDQFNIDGDEEEEGADAESSGTAIKEKGPGVQGSPDSNGGGEGYDTVQQQVNAVAGQEEEEGGGRESVPDPLGAPDDEITRLINEKYEQEEQNKDVSVIYKDSKVYDQPKKAVYGI